MSSSIGPLHPLSAAPPHLSLETPCLSRSQLKEFVYFHVSCIFLEATFICKVIFQMVFIKIHILENFVLTSVIVVVVMVIVQADNEESC